jgi:hypothetical protein
MERVGENRGCTICGCGQNSEMRTAPPVVFRSVHNDATYNILLPTSMMIEMPQQSKLLTLPRELRDLIYNYYLEVEGGYIPNYITKKLSRADGQPIDLTLAYTCKLVAAEMFGLPLKINKITFSTVYSDEERKKAGWFAANLASLSILKHGLLFAARSRCDADATRTVLQRYPDFQPIVTLLQRGEAMSRRLEHKLILKSFGELPSRYRQFVSEILNQMAATNLSSLRNTILEDWRLSWVCETLNLNNILSSKHIHEPWNIPTEEEVQSLCHLLGREPYDPQEYWKRTKYRFSAASAALRFLRPWSAQCLSQVRNVILNEDRVCVAWPECHAQGFIGLCQDNPALRVERRVNLWRNAFPAGSCNVSKIAGNNIEFVKSRGLHRLRSREISAQCLAPWVMEALALPGLGMPPQSFTLILDGHPILQHTSEAFKTAQRDAACQHAYETWWSDTNMVALGSWSCFEARGNRSYVMNGFAEAIRNISTSSVLVRSNFDVGEPWDDREFGGRGNQWTAEELNNVWWKHEPESFETESPLPSWLDMRREDTLPE